MARSLGGGGGSFGGGGGSRSFGGSHSGGSRSFGGFHAGSGSGSTRRVSSGGSSSRGSSYRRSGSYYGGGLPPRPPRPYYGRSYRRGYSGPVIINNGGGGVPTGTGGCGGGCLKTFLWIFLLAAIIGIIFSAIRMRDGSPSSYSTNNSGYGCTKYTGEVDKSHGYWEDNSKGEPWIDSSNSRYLEEGFESFYDETGVWPYLYVTDKYGNKGNFGTYEEAVYDQLFGNCPGNLLFVFIGDEESYYIAAGTGNGDVVNSKTIEVFQNKINKYWSNGDLGKIFGSAMKDAGKQLMKEQETQLLAKDNFKTIMIVLISAAGVVIVLLIAMSWWKKKKQAQKEEDERLEQILSQPLSTFGNTELHDLGKKYDNVHVPAGAGTGSAGAGAAGAGTASTGTAGTGAGTTGSYASDSVLNAGGGFTEPTTPVDTDSVLNHGSDGE